MGLMSELKYIMDACYQLMLMPIELAPNFSVNIFEVVVFLVIGGILLRFVSGALGDD